MSHHLNEDKKIVVVGIVADSELLLSKAWKKNQDELLAKGKRATAYICLQNNLSQFPLSKTRQVARLLC